METCDLLAEPLLSVIIPVYMVQDYLDQCVGSVVNQTYKNIEVILVDDGSKDGSSVICDRWAQTDSRIRVIHKENGGLSSARNAGLRVATGEYIAFLDSDDWLHPECYEKVVFQALSTKADIVGYDIYEVYGDEMRIRDHIAKLPKEVFRAFDCLPALFNMWPLVWAKIYRREFVFGNNIKFVEGVIYEDNPFVFGCWIRNPLISFVREPLHYYRMGRPGQITYGLNAKTQDIFSVIDVIRKDFGSLGKTDYFRYLIDWSVSNVVWLYSKTPDDLKHAYFKRARCLFMSYLFCGMCLPGRVKKKTFFSVLKAVFLNKI